MDNPKYYTYRQKINDRLCEISITEENERLAKELLFRKEGFSKIKKSKNPAYIREQEELHRGDYERFIYNPEGIKYTEILLLLKNRTNNITYIPTLTDVNYLIKYYVEELHRYFKQGFYFCIIDNRYFGLNGNSRLTKERLFRELNFEMIIKNDLPAYSSDKITFPKNPLYERFQYNSNGIKYIDIINKMVKLSNDEIFTESKDDYEYIKIYYANELENYVKNLTIKFKREICNKSGTSYDFILSNITMFRGKIIVPFRLCEGDIKYIKDNYRPELEKIGYEIDGYWYGRNGGKRFDKELLFRDKGFTMVIKNHGPAYSSDKITFPKNPLYERFQYNSKGINYIDIINKMVDLRNDEIFIESKDDYKYIKTYYAKELENHVKNLKSQNTLKKIEEDIIREKNESQNNNQETNANKTIKETNVSYRKIIINSQLCIACGLCIEASQLIDEASDGKAIVKSAGVVAGDKIKEFQQIVDICPKRAISLQPIASKDKHDLQELIQNKIRNYILPIPSRSEFDFDENIIRIPISFSGREYQYNYSSYNKAKNAAEEEFNRLMFSQRKAILQKVFIEYKVQKILPYYLYKNSSENFYYKVQEQIIKLLEELSSEAMMTKPGINLPSDFADFHINFDPKKFDFVGYFNDIYEQQQANIALDDLSSDCYSLSSYMNYCDIDDTEEYGGTGVFGSTKYVTKYCFHNLKEAFDELAKDMKGACKYVISNAADEAYNYLKSLWVYSEKQIKQELEKKAAILENALK